MIKVQIPIYSNLLLKTWKLPKLENTTTAVYNRQGIKTGIKESKRPIIVNLEGKKITEEEYRLNPANGTILTTRLYETTIKENKEYFNVKNEYITLINRFRENMEDQFIGGMPIQLEKKCLSVLLKENNGKLVYGMTLKADGVRHLMFLSKSGIIYFIDRITNVFYFKIEEHKISFKKSNNQFLFDGELIYHKSINKWEFLIFDVIYYNHNFTMNYNYYTRIEIINNALKDIKVIEPVSSLILSTKEWYSIDTMLLTENIYKFIIKDTNDKRKKLSDLPPLKDDGLVLQPFDESYVPFREWNVYNNVQFKWKPPKDLTIDFKIKIAKPNEWWLLTKTGQVFQVKQPDGENINAICIPTLKNKEDYHENDIVEFKIKENNNPQNNIFVAIRTREDKTEGNSYNTAMSTMEVIQNVFNLDELKMAIGVLKFKLPDIGPLIKLYSPSKLILCSLNASKELFFSETEVNSIKFIYLEYQQNKNKTPSLQNDYNIKGNPFLSKILKSRTDLYPVGKGVLKNNYELEFRVFPYIKKSADNPDDDKKTLKKGMYFYLLSFLIKSGYRYIYSFTIDIILNEYNPDGKFRSTYKDTSLTNPDNEFKEKTKSVRGDYANYVMEPTSEDKLYNNLTFKLNLSNEIKTKRKIALKTELHDRVVYNTTRIKKRFSFNINSNWRLDITRVITNHGKIDLNSTNETYELECEYIGGNISADAFVESMNYIYTLILMNSGYCI